MYAFHTSVVIRIIKEQICEKSVAAAEGMCYNTKIMGKIGQAFL